MIYYDEDRTEQRVTEIRPYQPFQVGEKVEVIMDEKEGDYKKAYVVKQRGDYIDLTFTNKGVASRKIDAKGIYKGRIRRSFSKSQGVEAPERNEKDKYKADS